MRLNLLNRMALAGMMLCVSYSGVLAQQRTPTGSDPNVPQNDAIEQRRNAFNVGAHLHSYGIGVDFQYTRVWKPRYEMLFNLALASFKERGEGRIPGAGASQGFSDYIFEKQNYTYFASLTAGVQYVILQRTEFSRVQLKAGLSTGPTLALLKPYLVYIVGSNPNFPDPVVYNPFVATNIPSRPHVPSDIIGEVDYFTNFSLSSQLGWRLRADVTLDLSGTSFFVRAIHAGVQYDFFSQPVPISTRDNRTGYFGGYLGFVIGSAW